MQPRRLLLYLMLFASILAPDRGQVHALPPLLNVSGPAQLPLALRPTTDAGAVSGAWLPAPLCLPDPSSVRGYEVGEEVLPATPPLLANNQIVAFYGNPNSRRMGILGEYPKEELGRLLKGYARLYDDINGPQGVVPAFYLIYGTCWPGGEIGYLKESLVLEYIRYAADHDMIVFLDHQIGKYGIDEAMNRLLPFLRYPNVHLALDPEWRTLAPMREIGSITAEELNRAQELMARYLVGEGLPMPRILVVHQFKSKMITGRERVSATYPGVNLIHTSDGFGSPSLKRDTYSYNAGASNIPLKGFKLFFKTTTPGAGYDEPLLTPPEVLALEPQPSLIIYQ